MIAIVRTKGEGYKKLFYFIFVLLFASTRTFANLDLSFKQLLKEKLLTLNIKSVSEYTNLGTPHIIKGQKLYSKDFDNINMPILKLHLSGFDTHADQLSRQSELLAELDTSITEFSAYLKSQSLWDNSLIYSFSEFGRRIAENGNSGTDHGEAYSGFAIGGKIQGNVYGSLPELSNKNLPFSIDHRQLLATLEKKLAKIRQQYIYYKKIYKN